MLNIKLSSPYVALGILVAVIAVAYFFYPRKREGFQATESTTLTPSPTQVASLMAQGLEATPPELIGNPDACKMVKNVLDTVTKQLEAARQTNMTTQIGLLEVSKDSLEKQLSKLKC